MTTHPDVALLASRVDWILWEEDCLAERRDVYWGPAMARAQSISVWQGEMIKGKLHKPEPPGFDLFDPRRWVLQLFLSSELDFYPPLTLPRFLCVRADLADLARSIGIIIHPIDHVRWFRAPHDPEAIEHGRVKWPPPHNSWIGEHPEVKRGSRPLYHLGIPPELPITPGSLEHRYRYRDKTGDPSEWQFDPEFLRRNPVSEIPGCLVITRSAPQPFLDMVADDEHFKVLPFLKPGAPSKKK
jgi:hypothetical protein